MKKHAAMFASVFAGILILAAACGSWFGSKDLKLSGTLELTEYSLGAVAAGRLETLTVDEGDKVAKGQLLGTLNRYAQAKLDYDRETRLAKERVNPSRYRELAELDFEDQKIVSPVDGIVLVKVREMGETLRPGDPVVVVGDPSKMWVRVYVPENKVSCIRLGESAVLKVDGLKDSFQGHVSFIATKAEFTPRNVQTPEERVTQSLAVKVMFDKPDPRLRAGVSATVTLKLECQ